ncbi:hypothetical protein DFH94DRAFT_690333 [Russula ochroleuca]|uniref:P-loop containing nucleoside triphosphate hydrolase protein n=1 Tax=Russula ochroleuca TaxID=152965 RepID=A0A9P5N1B6_9AGAM|nr:hypothetical protein DFH94DRAFT_690333 [Russula ochroleuca]
MPTSATILEQDEIPGQPSSATVREYALETLSEMKEDFIHATLSEDPSCVVGVSLGLARSGPHIRTLALATPANVFNLVLHRPPSPAQKRILRALFSKVPCLAGFELPYIIVLLAHTIGGEISGHDLSSAKFGSKTSYMRMPGALIRSKVSSASAGCINERWERGMPCSDTKSTHTLEPNHRVRAWFTAIAADVIQQGLERIQLLSSKFLTKAMLRCLVDLSTRSIRLESMKPRIQEIDSIKVQVTRNGSLMIENALYKTRVRKNKHTRVELQLENGGVIEAKTKGTRGRRTFVRTKQRLTGKVIRIRVMGCEDRTCAEKARHQFLSASLNSSHRRDAPFFVKAIWLPKNLKGKTGHRNASTKATREVATAMLSSSRCDSLVIVHGPPGTGKTTTIAAAAATWVDHGVPCWVVAQSNVGVKNIAETLVRRGVKFKLLVSKDFIFEWHEELYEEVKDVVIRSDILKQDSGISGTRQIFDGVTLVLSTLSMLSNPILTDYGLLKLIPVRSLVVDEASQIDVFDFMHLFHKFSKVLKKVCLFGDPKQLPPYGAQEAKLQTIFEVNHLSKTSYLLDTQWGFISETVYEGKLHSSHAIVDHSCIVFIDVEKGKEERRGMSYQASVSARDWLLA